MREGLDAPRLAAGARSRGMRETHRERARAEPELAHRRGGRAQAQFELADVAARVGQARGQAGGQVAGEGDQVATHVG